MSIVKMTDILVATDAFLVTLSTPSKERVNEWSQEDKEAALLEITPIISTGYTKKALAEQFFDIICSDSGNYNKNSRDALLHSFAQGCNMKIFEQFWDNSHFDRLEDISLSIPQVTCILYDASGNVVSQHRNSPLNIIWALKKIEETFFIYSMPAHMQPLVGVTSGMTRGLARDLASGGKKSRKDWRRDTNRQTHKYFLHHRHR